jgi:cytochrome oxidase Cu insertion factor (SCO1/SenC/PrrC family)
MNRQQVLKLGIAGMLTMVFLVACGSTGSTPLPETPLATSTPEPPVASDPLSTGDVAPDFTLPDSNGNIVRLADQMLDNRLVILVFYHNYT